MTTRIAVVGAGGIAQAVHLPILQRNRGRAALVALVELSPHRRNLVAGRYGIPDAARFATTTELVAAIGSGAIAVDAAILATSGLHCADVTALLGAGLTVLSEKPLAYSLSELDDLERFAEVRGIDLAGRLRIGYMKEYDPAVVEARQLLKKLSVRAVTIEVLHPADDRQLEFARLLPAETDLPQEAITAAGTRMAAVLTEALGAAPEDLRRTYSSVVLGSIVHDIALLRTLGFALETVTQATRWTDSFPGSITATGTTSGGTVPWQLGWHFIGGYPEYAETVTFHHEAGTLQLQFPTPYLLNAPTRLRTEAASSRLGRTSTDQLWPQEEAFERELFALLDLAEGRAAPGSSVGEARADLITAQLLHQALAASSRPRTDAVSEINRLEGDAAEAATSGHH